MRWIITVEAGSFSLVRGLLRAFEPNRVRTGNRVVLLDIYAQLVYVRMKASRPTVARMFGSEKLPNLSRQAFIAIFAEFKNRRIMCFCYFACWILKTKRRETSDVADFHRESARKGRVAAENRRSFIYCGGRQVAEAGLVRSILLITGRSSNTSQLNPTIKFKSGHKIRYLPFFNPGPHICNCTHRRIFENIYLPLPGPFQSFLP